LGVWINFQQQGLKSQQAATFSALQTK